QVVPTTRHPVRHPVVGGSNHLTAGRPPVSSGSNHSTPGPPPSRRWFETGYGPLGLHHRAMNPRWVGPPGVAELYVVCCDATYNRSPAPFNGRGQEPDLDEGTLPAEVAPQRDSAVAAEDHSSFQSFDGATRSEELLQAGELRVVGNVPASPPDGMAHLSEIVDPHVIDLAVRVREAHP